MHLLLQCSDCQSALHKSQCHCHFDKREFNAAVCAKVHIHWVYVHQQLRVTPKSDSKGMKMDKDAALLLLLGNEKGPEEVLILTNNQKEIFWLAEFYQTLHCFKLCIDGIHLMFLTIGKNEWTKIHIHWSFLFSYLLLSCSC